MNKKPKSLLLFFVLGLAVFNLNLSADIGQDQIPESRAAIKKAIDKLIKYDFTYIPLIEYDEYAWNITTYTPLVPHKLPEEHSRSSKFELNKQEEADSAVKVSESSIKKSEPLEIIDRITEEKESDYIAPIKKLADEEIKKSIPEKVTVEMFVYKPEVEKFSSVEDEFKINAVLPPDIYSLRNAVETVLSRSSTAVIISAEYESDLELWFIGGIITDVQTGQKAEMKYVISRDGLKMMNSGINE